MTSSRSNMFVNLYRLKVFIQVAECRSFSKAADQLFLSQPSVSVHIKRLEKALGVTLFERTGRLTLTPAGQALLEGASKLIAGAEETEANVKQRVGILAGTVVAGISRTWERPLVQAACDFQGRHPKVFLFLTAGILEEFIPLLLAKQMGLAFVMREAHDPRLDVEVVGSREIRLLAVCRSDNPLATFKRIEPHDLEQFPVVRFSPGKPSPVFDYLGARLRYVMAVDSDYGFLLAVQAGVGVSVVVEGAHPIPIGLKAIPIAGPPFRQSLVLVKARHHRLSNAEQALVDHVVARLPDLTRPRTD